MTNPLSQLRSKDEAPQHLVADATTINALVTLAKHDFVKG